MSTATRCIRPPTPRRWAPPQLRKEIAHSFIDVLAELHSIDPDSVGLGDLGKKDDYIGRQLKTWYRSWTASIAGAQLDDPRAHELQKYLLEHVPEQGPARIVHGDYGLHNTLVGPDGRIAAVVDWEISTLGDPLADLAYALNQWAEPGDPPSVRGVPPTTPARLADAPRTGRALRRAHRPRPVDCWTTTSASTAGRARPSCTASTRATWKARRAPWAWTCRR